MDHQRGVIALSTDLYSAAGSSAGRFWFGITPAACRSAPAPRPRDRASRAIRMRGGGSSCSAFAAASAARYRPRSRTRSRSASPFRQPFRGQTLFCIRHRHGDTACAQARRNCAESPRNPWSRAFRRSARAAAELAPPDRRAWPRSRGRLPDCGRRRATIRCPRGQRESLPCVSRCIRAGHSALTSPASNACAGNFSPAARKAAIAVPALMN